MNLQSLVRDKIIANAVQTTFRFNPIGEHYGDWYIPSIAEWCYVLDKLYEINFTLKLLIKKQIFICVCKKYKGKMVLNKTKESFNNKNFLKFEICFKINFLERKTKNFI